MTGHANSLTERARSAIGAASPLSTPASDLRVLIDGLVRLGHRRDAVLSWVGLRDDDLDNPDARFPCELSGELVSRAQKERFMPNLALALAQLTPLGAYPLLDYLVLTSDTVGAGVRQLARYFGLVGSPVAIRLQDQVDPIRIELGGRPAPFGVEYLSALMVLHLRAETDGRFCAAQISFQHAPDDRSGFERVLGCPVAQEASWNGVCVAPDSWRLSLRRRDPVLRQLLESRADDVITRLPARSGPAQEIQRELAGRVAGGDTRIATVARRLAMSGRTLQRKLAAEGVSYQDLLDEARREAAGRYLSGSTLAIGEVAYLVGYSEPAPFHRAFKRWYGTTPDLFRQAQRSVNAAQPPAERGPRSSTQAR